MSLYVRRRLRPGGRIELCVGWVCLSVVFSVAGAAVVCERDQYTGIPIFCGRHTWKEDQSKDMGEGVGGVCVRMRVCVCVCVVWCAWEVSAR